MGKNTKEITENTVEDNGKETEVMETKKENGVKRFVSNHKEGMIRFGIGAAFFVVGAFGKAIFDNLRSTSTATVIPEGIQETTVDVSDATTEQM